MAGLYVPPNQNGAGEQGGHPEDYREAGVPEKCHQTAHLRYDTKLRSTPKYMVITLHKGLTVQLDTQALPEGPGSVGGPMRGFWLIPSPCGR